MVVVVVSTGTKGNAEEDRVLTQARALVVRQYLVEKFNLDDARLKTKASGMRSTKRGPERRPSRRRCLSSRDNWFEAIPTHCEVNEIIPMVNPVSRKIKKLRMVELFPALESSATAKAGSSMKRSRLGSDRSRDSTSWRRASSPAQAFFRNATRWLSSSSSAE